MKKILLFVFTVFFAGNLLAQNVLKGVIVDDENQPYYGVNVYEKGTTNLVNSAFDGSYSINYHDENSIIVFSFVGVETQEIIVGTQTELNIQMVPNNVLNSVNVVGSRMPNRTVIESSVPVDMIEVSKFLLTVGQTDVNQMLQFSAPSFNSNKQSGADGADHIDPATLRGLGPDQTLVLINGKRRHQTALVNIFGSRGRGNTGTDLNSIPMSAIDHIEILRDGAAAQYGSDAIAGVINIVLKSNTDEFTGNIITGVRNANPGDEYAVLKNDNTFDGEMSEFSGNYGTKIGEKGFLNMTLDYMTIGHTNRPTDPTKYDNYRTQFGDAASENFSAYMNSSFSVGEQSEIYMFGGYNYRNTDAYAFTRFADEERNVIEIYPNGFDPEIKTNIADKSFTAGFKTIINGFTLDLSNTIGANNLHYFVDNTLNSSLLTNSPTFFDAGGFSLLQNTTDLNLSRYFPKVAQGLNLAMGLESRVESYKIFAGEEGSYKTYGPEIFAIDGVDTILRPGGSQGFPGFQPSNELNVARTNFGSYVDLELNVTDKFTVSAAGRFERYSDFGNTINGKFSTRYKILRGFSVRGSVSTGFRAPSLAQLYYNTTFTDIIGGVAVDKIIAKNNSPLTRTLGIPELKEEISFNAGLGFTASYKSLTLTVDAYYVKIDDRIVLTGTFYSDDPDIGAEIAKQNVSAAQFFTNAVNTTTSGIDAILAYSLMIGGKQSLKFSAAANFNDMSIDKIYTNDKLAGKETTYFGVREQYFLLASAPQNKYNFGVDYSIGGFYANFKLTQFGKVELINWNDNGDDVVDASELDTYDPKITMDLSAGYKFKNLSITVGGANILNAYPDQHDASVTESGGLWDCVQMGFSGAFYFAKLGFKF